MGKKQWANTPEKKAFLASLQAIYNAVKTDTKRGVTNIPLRNFLRDAYVSYHKTFDDDWSQHSLPTVGKGGSKEDREEAGREVSPLSSPSTG
jgi:hypothetical protein